MYKKVEEITQTGSSQLFGYYNQEIETNNKFSDCGGNKKGLNILRGILCGYHKAYGREMYSEINRSWGIKLD